MADFIVGEITTGLYFVRIIRMSPMTLKCIEL